MSKMGEKKCRYCQGVGYFQLVTGGTETCPHCKGAGETELPSLVFAAPERGEELEEFNHCSMFRD